VNQLVSIDIFGQKYTFKAEKGVDNAKEIADSFANEVKKIESQFSNTLPEINKITILIISALNIANEKHEINRNYLKLLDLISEHSIKILKKIEFSDI